jgi:hypothetical protein
MRSIGKLLFVFSLLSTTFSMPVMAGSEPLGARLSQKLDAMSLAVGEAFERKWQGSADVGRRVAG